MILLLHCFSLTIDSPVPFIHCPGNIAVTLAPQKRTYVVTFSQPKSNMDWFRYVESKPTWAKQLGGEVDVGLTKVEFTVHSPVSNLSASCDFTIEVNGKFRYKPFILQISLLL